MYLNEQTMTEGIWAYIFFFVALEPAAFSHFDIICDAFVIAQKVMFGIALYFWVTGMTRERARNSRICIALIVYYAYLYYNTSIHNGRTHLVLDQAIQFVGFCLYLDLVLKRNPRELFRSALNILVLYVGINCLLVYVMPNGLYRTSYFSNNYLLGYDNQNINFMLPAMVLVLLKHVSYRKCREQIVFVFALCWLTAIRIWSGMTLMIVGLVSVMAFFCLLSERKGKLWKLIPGNLVNLFTLLFADIFANYALVILRLQNRFQYLIENVLGKDLTLSRRIYIWDRTLDIVKQNPWFGYGRDAYAARAMKISAMRTVKYKSNSPAGLHAHNRFLEVTYLGGLVLLAWFLGMLFYAAARLFPLRRTRFAKILSLGIFFYLIGMLTEFYDYCIFFWGMLVIAENARHLLAQLSPSEIGQ